MIEVVFNPDTLADQLRVAADQIVTAVVDELFVAAGEVVETMRSTWPRRTGRSAKGFGAYRISGGVRLRNDVPYVPHVHRAGTQVRALDELTTPAIETAIRAVPDRAAARVATRGAP